MHAVLNGPIPTPRSVAPGVPERLDGIVMKALAIDVAKRYATCLELQKDIDDYLRETHAESTANEVGAAVQGMFEKEGASRREIIRC